MGTMPDDELDDLPDDLPDEAPACPECADLGWVLMGDPRRTPLTLDLAPCPLGHDGAGRPLEALAVAGRFAKANLHPTTRAVMSLTGARDPHDPATVRPAATTPPAGRGTATRVPPRSSLPPGARPAGR